MPACALSLRWSMLCVRGACVCVCVVCVFAPITHAHTHANCIHAHAHTHTHTPSTTHAHTHTPSHRICSKFLVCFASLCFFWSSTTHTDNTHTQTTHTHARTHMFSHTHTHTHIHTTTHTQRAETEARRLSNTHTSPDALSASRVSLSSGPQPVCTWQTWRRRNSRPQPRT